MTDAFDALPPVPPPHALTTLDEVLAYAAKLLRAAGATEAQVQTLLAQVAALLEASIQQQAELIDYLLDGHLPS
jgi:hypothetical protein